MAKCKKCNGKTALVKGHANFVPDSEPYENGKEEKVSFISIEKPVMAHYCEKCDELQNIWEE